MDHYGVHKMGSMKKIQVSCPQCEGTGAIQVEARECVGCGTGFVQLEMRQRYCNARCRHATNQRAYDRRKKERVAATISLMGAADD